MKSYYSEIEPFCCAVLKTQIAAGNLEEGWVDQRDVRNVKSDELRDFRHIHLFAGIGGFAAGFHRAKLPDGVRILTAGFPCQDLSVAGKRAGLGGDRSSLFWEAHRIIGELQPAWFVLENVPGLFSSFSDDPEIGEPAMGLCGEWNSLPQTDDFETVLGAMDELGYGLAWRVLNSQYFGVAQRRRRVFIVGRFGEPCPAEVLFESESGAGDFTESGAERPRAAGEIAGCLGSIGDGGFSTNCEKAADGYLQLVANSLSASNGHHGHSSPRGDGSDNLISVRLAQTSSNGWGISEDGTTHTLDSTGGDAICAYHENLSGNVAAADNARALRSGASHSYQFVSSTNPEHEERSSQQLHTAGKVDGAMHGNGDVGSSVDSHRMRNFTELPKGMDSARYRALGNAVTVSVSFWIAKRIKEWTDKNDSE